MLPKPDHKWQVRLLRWLPAAFITVLGLYVLWPIPRGVMPLSADHTVHLTRTWLWSQELASGAPRGWSTVWFFGTPVGELYPVLGDALIIAAKVCTFGLAAWPTAYAIGFTFAFLTQGWVLLRAGRCLGWGVVPGLVAASLALLDVGSYREGGYIYTVYYGVWPQALATSLTWLGLAELTQLPDANDGKPTHRRIASAALAMGAALLAHPMSIAVLGVAGPVVVFTSGARSITTLKRSTSRGLLAGALGLGLAAWWIVPMLEHRAWMASYGWLWQPLDVLWTRAMDGHWAQSMPPLAGHCVTAGFVLVALVGNRAARAFAVTAAVLWVMSARDIPWDFRLDLVSEGFTHLQYQRFSTAAKPGLFLLAGAFVGGLLHLGRTLWTRGGTPTRVVAALSIVASLSYLGLIARGQREEIRKNPVAGVQEIRMPRMDTLDQDYAALLVWMREQWQEREDPFRFAVFDQRNTHWFMDAPVFAEGAPVLKLGFTPGDNFVHKPEKGTRELLDRARVRYEIRRGQRKRPGEVARFGLIGVTERKSWKPDAIATLDGEGTLSVLEDDTEHGRIRIRIDGTPEPAAVVFGIAGFPRWRLNGPQGPIEWYEAPASGEGPGVTQSQRREGIFRGGKAGGDDGTEPTLIAANLSNGEYQLEYQRWTARDVLALLLSVLTTALVGVLLFGRAGSRVDGPLKQVGKLGHPIVWGAAVIALVGGLAVKVQRGRTQEHSNAVGHALDGRASVLQHVRPEFLKADMLIRPALVFDRRHQQPAIAAFEGLQAPQTLRGWIALDDDDTKRKREGNVSIRIEARPRNEGEWTTLFTRKMPHRAGITELDLPLNELAGAQIDLRIVSEANGKRPPELGISLTLEDIP